MTVNAINCLLYELAVKQSLYKKHNNEVKENIVQDSLKLIQIKKAIEYGCEYSCKELERLINKYKEFCKTIRDCITDVIQCEIEIIEIINPTCIPINIVPNDN